MEKGVKIQLVWLDLIGWVGFSLLRGQVDRCVQHPADPFSGPGLGPGHLTQQPGNP
jgi:hypothetical protein